VVWARHLVPLVPFGAVAAAALAASAVPWVQATAGALAIASLGSGIAAYPNYMSHLGLLAGTPARASRWFADSNVDWGQDLKPLAKRLHDLGVSEVALAYYGTADPSFYGIKGPSAYDIHSGWYAVSRTLLVGLYAHGDSFRWLRKLDPAGDVGGSIALYHVDEATAASARADQPPEVGLHKRLRDDMQEALRLLYIQDDPRKAIGLLDEIVKDDPENREAMLQRSIALERAGLRKEAIESWRQLAQSAETAGDSSARLTADAQLTRLIPSK
jgi:tetratricopeptide (TPR) repeat protein